MVKNNKAKLSLLYAFRGTDKVITIIFLQLGLPLSTVQLGSPIDTALCTHVSNNKATRTFIALKLSDQSLSGFLVSL